MILNEYFALSNGVKIPKLGLGTRFIEDSKVPEVVKQAVQIGCRHIDTAQAYGNEAGLRGYLQCLPGAKEKGIIYGTGSWDKGNVYRHPSFEKAYEMGKTIGGK